MTGGAPRKPRLSAPGLAHPCGGRLAPLALDDAEDRLALCHAGIGIGGLTRDQIENVDLIPLLVAARRVWRHLVAHLVR